MTLAGVVTFREVGIYNFCLCDIVLPSTKFMFENYNRYENMTKYVLSKFMILVLGQIYGYPCCMRLQVGHT